MTEKKLTAALLAKSGWSISKFYSDAWKLTMTHKKLWILGFAVAIFASGGMSRSSNFHNSQTSSSSSSTSTTQTQQIVKPVGSPLPQAPGKPVAVFKMTELGVAAPPDKVFNDVVHSMEQIPAWAYVMLAIEVIIFIVIAVVLSFVARGWAKGALILGVRDAVEKDVVDLASASRAAMGRIPSMIWLSIVPALLFIVAFIVGTIVIFFVSAISPVIGMIAGIVGIFAAAYYWIRIIVAEILAERYCVRDSLSGRDAFDKGYATAKGHLWKSGRLGILNTIAGTIGVLLPISLVILPIFAGIFLAKISLIPFILATTAFLFMVFVWSALFNGMWKVFTYTTWYFAFKYMDTYETDTHK